MNRNALLVDFQQPKDVSHVLILLPSRFSQEDIAFFKLENIPIESNT